MAKQAYSTKKADLQKAWESLLIKAFLLPTERFDFVLHGETGLRRGVYQLCWAQTWMGNAPPVKMPATLLPFLSFYWERKSLKAYSFKITIVESLCQIMVLGQETF